MKTISALVSDDFHDRFVRASERRELTVSTFLRFIAEEALDRTAISDQQVSDASGIRLEIGELRETLQSSIAEMEHQVIQSQSDFLRHLQEVLVSGLSSIAPPKPTTQPNQPEGKFVPRRSSIPPQGGHS